MANAPIQVILRADTFRKDRIKPKVRGTSKKDFFEGRDADFQDHQQKLRGQLQAVEAGLRATGADSMGYVKVTLQASAWAKTHRPREVLFKDHVAPSVGAGRLGELINEVTPTAIGKIDAAIAKAEVHVATKVDKKTNETVLAPTPYRCEASAIERIELWSKSDRRAFDIGRAIDWLSDPRTGHAYLVELFARPPEPGMEDTVPNAKMRLFTTLSAGLRELGPGVMARLRPGPSNDSVMLEVKLTTDTEPPAVFVQSGTKRGAKSNFDPDRGRHTKLLSLLESHPLVREIQLPAVVVRSGSAPPRSAPGTAWVPPAKGQGEYPRIGVVDGGLGKQFGEWVIYNHNFLADAHSDLEHGSFIGGLLVGAKQLNPSLSVDGDGCLVADLNIFAEKHFDQYFPNGPSDFFDELDAAVEICAKQYDVRVFNMSLNVVSPVTLDNYSFAARRLDQIADKHGAIFVISAGNLAPGNLRAEWPNDEVKATTILAMHRDDGLFSPAESIRNVSVAAINPEGMTSCLGGAPARYSRRGPGLRAGVKPDLCHVGGSGTPCPIQQLGLFSSDAAGVITSDCGTSYAAPLVAKTIGWLDAEIEGTPSRETLIALAVHKAKLPPILAAEAFQGVAQQLVGFGRPPPSTDLIDGGDHDITLLFSSRIFDGKTLEFKFVWPACLVNSDGSCRGDVRLTLVSTPTLDYQYRDELVRVNIEAALQQETKNGKFKSELEPTYVFFSETEKVTEAELIEHKFKWSPVKAFAAHMPKGRGTSSNWRLVVNYLTRAGEVLPKEGIPFSVLLTIADPQGKAEVFKEMHQALQASGVTTADIRTAARVTSRV